MCSPGAALSRAVKAGLGTEVRQVLGLHSTGKRSHEIYNRDLSESEQDLSCRMPPDRGWSLKPPKKIYSRPLEKKQAPEKALRRAQPIPLPLLMTLAQMTSRIFTTQLSTDDYTQVDSSRFLDFRKCKRCDVAKRSEPERI